VLQWEPREWGARVLSGIEEYYQCALDCLRLANETNEQRTRTFLVDMAQRWNQLAELAAKNSRVDLVYETPEPKDQTG
jgi:hypothetical protein